MKKKLFLFTISFFISSVTAANVIYKPFRYERNRYQSPCEICTIPHEVLILDKLTQNQGRSASNPCEPFWFDRIQISGGINFDFGKWGNRNVGNQLPFITLNDGYAGENTNVISLNDAYINLSACVNEWTKAFLSISYLDTSDFYSIAYTTGPDSLVIGDINRSIALQQAFFRISNFDYTPIFFEFGQQFQDYGRYALHPITESMTQSLTETLHTSGKVGFILDWGLHGSAAAFQVPVPKTPGGTYWFDYIGAIGLDREDCGARYDFGLGYIYNIFGINLIGNTAALREGLPPSQAVFHKVVSAFALYGDLNYDPVTFSIRYTTASRPLSPLDVPKNLVHPTIGAKPWAASAQFGYSFCLACLNQNIYFGYQISRETVNLNLPRDRWLVGYNMLLYKDLTLTAEYDHDIAHSVAEGGATHGNSNLLTFRIAMKFT